MVLNTDGSICPRGAHDAPLPRLRANSRARRNRPALSSSDPIHDKNDSRTVTTRTRLPVRSLGGAVGEAAAFRAERDGNPTHFGDISNFEKEGFDDFVGVLFEADFTVRCAYLATYDWVAKNGTVVQGKQRVNIGSFLAAANADELEKLDLDQN